MAALLRFARKRPAALAVAQAAHIQCFSPPFDVHPVPVSLSRFLPQFPQMRYGHAPLAVDGAVDVDPDAGFVVDGSKSMLVICSWAGTSVVDCILASRCVVGLRWPRSLHHSSLRRWQH